MTKRLKKRESTRIDRLQKAVEQLNEAAADSDHRSSAFSLIFTKLQELPGLPGPLSANEYLRLRTWLETASDEKRLKRRIKATEAFSALLQVWLRAHGIVWPRGVFCLDLAAGGSGSHNVGRGAEVKRLVDKGRSDDEIARSLFGSLYDENPSKARKKVKDAKRNYRPRDDPFFRLGDLPEKMMGITYPFGNELLDEVESYVWADIRKAEGLDETGK